MLSLAKEENMPKLTDSQLIVLSKAAARPRFASVHANKIAGLREPKESRDSFAQYYIAIARAMLIMCASRRKYEGRACSNQPASVRVKVTKASLTRRSL
jgi:hypothetical protein